AALVSLRGGEREDMAAAGDDDEAHFLAVQELLDHDGIAGGAEAAAEHAARGTDCRLVRIAYHHTLACRESIRLHHQRQALRSNEARIEIFRRECRVARGRDAVALQEVLGERL